MIRTTARSSAAARRAGQEFVTMWERLVAAAGHGARRVEAASRRQRRRAARRLAAASRALRGAGPSPLRWWGAGVVTGVAGTIAAGAVVRRLRRRTQASTVDGPDRGAAWQDVAESPVTAGTTRARPPVVDRGVSVADRATSGVERLGPPAPVSPDSEAPALAELGEAAPTIGRDDEHGR